MQENLSKSFPFIVISNVATTDFRGKALTQIDLNNRCFFLLAKILEKNSLAAILNPFLSDYIPE